MTYLFDKKTESDEGYEGWVPFDSIKANKIENNNKTQPDPTVSDEKAFSPLYRNGNTSNAHEGFTAIYTADDSIQSKSAGKKFGAYNSTNSEGTGANENKSYDDGFSKGEKNGYEEGKKRAEEMIRSMQEILNKVEDLWPKMTSEYEEKILQLVYRAAEKVVYGHIDIDNDIVKRAILNAFELIPKPLDATININPDDYEYIETTKENLFDNIKQLKSVSIVSNPSVSRGGCLIESRAGNADSSIEKRLESIKTSIISAAEKSRNRHPV